MALPLLANQVSDEMNWDVADFVVLGLVLLLACGLFELARRMTGSRAYRAAAAVAIGAALLLVWMNLAVGIIGSEDNPANLMYGAVFGIAFLGALIARLEPLGMSRTLVAMATAQVLIGVIALALGLGSEGENWPRVIFVLNGFFAALWLASAWLFHKAGSPAGPK